MLGWTWNQSDRNQCPRATSRRCFPNYWSLVSRFHHSGKLFPLIYWYNIFPQYHIEKVSLSLWRERCKTKQFFSKLDTIDTEKNRIWSGNSCWWHQWVSLQDLCNSTAVRRTHSLTWTSGTIQTLTLIKLCPLNPTRRKRHPPTFHSWPCIFRRVF